MYTFGQFITECENYQYSQEYYDIKKDIAELELMERYVENQRFIAEAADMYQFTNGFLMEAIDKEKFKEIASNVAEKAKNTVRKIIKILIRFFLRVISAITSLFNRLRNSKTKKEIHQTASICNIKREDAIAILELFMAIDEFDGGGNENRPIKPPTPDNSSVSNKSSSGGSTSLFNQLGLSPIYDSFSIDDESTTGPIGFGNSIYASKHTVDVSGNSADEIADLFIKIDNVLNGKHPGSFNVLLYSTNDQLKIEGKTVLVDSDSLVQGVKKFADVTFKDKNRAAFNIKEFITFSEPDGGSAQSPTTLCYYFNLNGKRLQDNIDELEKIDESINEIVWQDRSLMDQFRQYDKSLSKIVSMYIQGWSQVMTLLNNIFSMSHKFLEIYNERHGTDAQ